MVEALTNKIIKELFSVIDTRTDDYLNILREAVGIPSISTMHAYKDDVINMIKWTEHILKGLHMKTEIVPGKAEGGGGDPRPPFLLARTSDDNLKKTVLVYGHLDVKPAAREDGWLTNPFDLTVIDGKLYGRGASDNKGPIFCWLNAISAYKEKGYSLPVNVKFLLESGHECGSIGLEEVIKEKMTTFFHNVDFICYSDCSWLGNTQPCLIYGIRGVCYFSMEIQKNEEDKRCDDSSSLADLLYMLDHLTETNDKLIEMISKDVKEVTEEERNNFFRIDFCNVDYEGSLSKVKSPKPEDKVEILTNHWRRPSLYIHDIKGTMNQFDRFDNIPHHVAVDFSLYLVPNQNPFKVGSIVKQYLKDIWLKKDKNKNKFRVIMLYGVAPWETDPNNFHYKTAAKATKLAYNVNPDIIMHKGKVPVVLTLAQTIGSSLLMLPLSAGDDRAGLANEKFDIRNYIQGIKLIVAYMHELQRENHDSPLKPTI